MQVVKATVTKTLIRRSKWSVGMHLQVEVIEQLPLISVLSPHHRQISHCSLHQESVFVTFVQHFFDSIGQTEKKRV